MPADIHACRCSQLSVSHLSSCLCQELSWRTHPRIEASFFFWKSWCNETRRTTIVWLSWLPAAAWTRPPEKTKQVKVDRLKRLNNDVRLDEMHTITNFRFTHNILRIFSPFALLCAFCCLHVPGVADHWRIISDAIPVAFVHFMVALCCGLAIGVVGKNPFFRVIFYSLTPTVLRSEIGINKKNNNNNNNAAAYRSRWQGAANRHTVDDSTIVIQCLFIYFLCCSCHTPTQRQRIFMLYRMTK